MQFQIPEEALLSAGSFILGGLVDMIRVAKRFQVVEAKLDRAGDRADAKFDALGAEIRTGFANVDAKFDKAAAATDAKLDRASAATDAKLDDMMSEIRTVRSDLMSEIRHLDQKVDGIARDTSGLAQRVAVLEHAPA